ncbi:hypothetical protein K470DRAFT_258315 [Piedraia hortae CBS 480.64]|uniref:YMC020W-like alpha/beta hydrolase domain-containing protein n=1 Tax=Piedraia hortae CBS 480.64 TaxID=1314780 RepID=A0A6A7BXM7_9PEZI|nr:hypothetical protein K470DRAFT_258315 [Piedraia hortae CBS 480.64]
MASGRQKGSKTAADENKDNKPDPSTTDADKKPPRARSWYNGGSWRTKAGAITQIANESVSVTGGATSEASETAQRPNQSVSKGLRGSRKSGPLVAEETRVHAIIAKTGGEQPLGFGPEAFRRASLDPKDSSAIKDNTYKLAQQAGTWFGWWSRPDGYGSDEDKSDSKRRKVEDESAANGVKETAPDSSASPTVQGSESMAERQDNQRPDLYQSFRSSRMWFSRWSKEQNEHAVAEAQMDLQPEAPEAEFLDSAADVAGKAKSDSKPRKSTGWAFWAGNRKSRANSTDGPHKEVGELAVADTPSQSHPEAAQFEEHQTQPTDEKAEAEDEVQDTNIHTDTSDTSTKLRRRNHILPSLRDTYPLQVQPGYLERLSTSLAQKLRLQDSEPPPSHPYIVSSPLLVKKAVAIGVHGYVPAPLIQRVLGPPTGTSIRFANHAADAIQSWCQEHQPTISDVEIEKVALEGEGVIADRVATLWKLLLNWLDHLRQANFILVACHSQGVPVAFMLVAKLIRMNAISPRTRIGICAMAGINLGPFPEYRSRWFGGSALELFDFGNASSVVSREYAQAVDTCLRHGVRAMFVGSLDDQLVSLESSLFAPLHHPYAARAVFVDRRLRGPDFLAHLVAFALKLRNRGISDHGLLREVSAPLAGSLMGGEGHSRLYDDPNVYKHAIEFALETSDVNNTVTTAVQPSAADRLLATDAERSRRVAAQRRAGLSGLPTNMATANRIRRGSASAAAQVPGIASVMIPTDRGASNPFYLPWAVRGMLEEDIVKREPKMQEEVAQLVNEFEEWRPTSKALKDIRWRLEGVRSML